MDGTVEGTFGSDIIDESYTGDPEGDRIDANDALLPGASGNDDLVEAGPGNDTVLAGDGDDVVYGGADDDRLYGGDGADTLNGDEGQDILWGDAGDDVLDGGSGDDTLKGGNGEDILSGGEGADVIGGGDDADTVIAGAGDEIDGGAGGDDNDTLDLSGIGPYALVGVVPDSNGNGFDGTVVLLDADGSPTGEVIEFTEIEFIVDDMNSDPIAVDDGPRDVPEDGSITLPVLFNDSDPDGDALTVIEATAPNGTVTINPTGTLTYTPNPDYNGPDQITYTISDGNGGTDTAVVDLNVTPVNDAPDAVDDADTTDFDTPITVDLLANDTDVDGDALSVVSATVPAEEGSLVDNGDGTVTFTPVAGFTGTATITYTIEDEEGLQDTAVHTIEVIAPVLDGTVEGTDGDDVIDVLYTGDPEGDRVDNNDAILPGDTGNDDLIHAYDGDDTVLAGDGDDEVFGMDGNDDIDTGDGNDVVYGGNGNDIIDTTDDETLAGDFDNPYPPLPVDPIQDNDLDTVYGGAGDDVIFTGDDRDTIFGGDGNDSIDAGIDDDEVTAGRGDDTVVGSEGNDLIYGGDGDDVIYGGLDPSFPDALNIPDEDGDLVPDNGQDLIYGGAGNDIIFGEDDDDTIFGGRGDDVIDGGVDDDSINGQSGDDSITGGQGDDIVAGGDGNDILDGEEGDDTIFGNVGNDVITGGEGADELFGGDDRDTFIGGDAGEVVDGGAGGDDFDTLDLTGSDVDFITYTSPDREDGIVTFLDGTTMTFTEIENVIPCFTPGTTIATPRGERLVEDLREGDRIITRDNGIQEIRWVGRKDLTGKNLVGSPHLRPVLIKAGSLGNGLPERDMLVSPNHRLLVANDRTQLYFEESEVLAAAKHLVGSNGVHQVNVMQVSYIHFMFDRHEVVLSNGAWTESFQPGDYSLKGLGNSQRNEIFELFPELASKQGLEGYQSARKSLKKHEAKLLVK
ncbi:Hint domain-containing protein [Ponticoccus sp. SC2-23]|uniref:Hint domain-containing protein n=1 Tax=Alexandriicola marinus TaxID=2081710 RepID=UPI000FD9DC96|nr:Hint domain-containing protein [Alexandriicola marinus]MBM1218886.1 Hint domain-containing protein [Ponticoccus sp. SC6-9]MBM1224042.1 Hint domain-containing protein [Ponticoccus sp. SC6-15]MBM1230179.1 Hint domain-containing protein [Ponticoccus sp. SC6-38]MBM1233008.1 Hint domain-containing protein [Ponticoccus sp. SC6-45]MBM1237042.1 Hint domain-containing protein [Ponticoccus sp. SC6-49]MBM1242019.1 Hint domain-containing protein [Ponticoccus sp. SC2-64]MBM1246532.1 Hint domain-contai